MFPFNIFKLIINYTLLYFTIPLFFIIFQIIKYVIALKKIIFPLSNPLLQSSKLINFFILAHTPDVSLFAYKP